MASKTPEHEPRAFSDPAAATLPKPPSIEELQSQLLWKGFRQSAIVHGALLILLIIFSFTLAREPVKFVPSIRVDLVALPDLKKSDVAKTPSDMDELKQKLADAAKSMKKEAAKPAPPKDEPAPAPDDTLAMKKEKPAPSKEKKKDLKSAIDRIKALADIENEVKDQSKKKTTVAKGNAIAKGNSLTGENSGDVNEYVDRMRGKLQDNWNIPVWLSKQGFSAKVILFLDKGGYVSKTVLAKSSGNLQFDDYVLKTVRMAQPFGPPPEDILDAGLTLGFPL